MDLHIVQVFLGVSKKPRQGESCVEKHESAEAKLALDCFTVPFKGYAHRELYEQLSALCMSVKQERHYSPYAALVQSSGTGKSRALRDMSKLSVYVCYCSLASRTSTAVPPRTGDLADKLVTTFNERGMVLHLNAWLKVLAAELNDMSSEKWMEEQLCKDSPFANKVLAEWKRLETETPYGADCDAKNAKIYSDAVRSVEEGLRKKCSQCPLEHYVPCSVIFSFDEARGLQVPDSGTQLMSDSPFYQVRRALRVFLTTVWSLQIWSTRLQK